MVVRMIQTRSRRRHDHHQRARFLWLPPLTIIAAVAAAVGVGIGIGSLLEGGKHSRLCDQYVHTLLTTTDLVEVQPAAFLVRYLDYGVTRRAPEP